jgi:hypothetical protein
MATKQNAKPTRSGGPKFNSMIEEGEDTAIVPQSGLTNYSQTPQLDSQDLFIPRLRLAQGLTAEVTNGEAKAGQWLVLGSSPMETTTVIPVAMTKRRELRDVEARMVVCRSVDSVTGIGDPGGDCGICPMAQWVKNAKTGKNNAPECSFIYSYMVYVVEAKTLAVLEFTRTAITAGKMLNTMIVQGGIGTFAITLGASGRQGPKGNYYSPTISPAKITKVELTAALTEAKGTLNKA